MEAKRRSAERGSGEDYRSLKQATIYKVGMLIDNQHIRKNGGESDGWKSPIVKVVEKW